MAWKQRGDNRQARRGTAVNEMTRTVVEHGTGDTSSEFIDTRP
jgi:hypothetical protein